MEKVHYVYIIKHPIGYYYIGKRTGQIDDDYMGSGVKINNYYKKYPKKQWTKEIVSVTETEQMAYNIEEVLVNKETLQDPMCLNIALGGKAVRKGSVVSEETRQKLREHYQRIKHLILEGHR